MEVDDKAAALFVVVLLLVFGIKHMIHSAVYQGEELTACQDFVKANDAVAREFGSLQDIKPKGGGNRKFGRNPSGRMVFCVTGTQKSEYLRVSWAHRGEDVVVTDIAVPLGFWKETNLWPEYRPAEAGWLLPFHIWYKLGYVLDVFISAFIAACIVWRRSLSLQFASAANSEVACRLILLAGTCSLMYASLMSVSGP